MVEYSTCRKSKFITKVNRLNIDVPYLVFNKKKTQMKKEFFSSLQLYDFGIKSNISK